MIQDDEGKRKTALGIYWGAKDSAGYSWISLSRTHVGIINCHGGDHKSDKHEYTTIRPALKKDVPYVVSIRKKDNKYQVFLNDVFKMELPYENLKGDDLAIAAWSNSIVTYDYFKVYYLD